MGEHLKAAGLRLIADLADLGRALQYSVALEFPIAKSSAKVDVAWFGAGDTRSPLMIFEVESDASSSMANNAMKVFSRESEDFLKPLFFFHLLLRGGPDNDRIRGLRTQWGTQNYRVYRLNSRDASSQLVQDVLSQHRRISSSVPLGEFLLSLRDRGWDFDNCRRAVDRCKELGFVVNYDRSLARSARADSGLIAIFLEHLNSVAVTAEAPRGLYSDNVIPYYRYSDLLELAVLVATDALEDASGATLMEEWQRDDGILRRIGPNLGLSRDYDSFLLGCVPSALYGGLAIILRHKPISLSWVVGDLWLLLRGQLREGVLDPYNDLGYVWLLHIAAAALSRDRLRERQVALRSAYDWALSQLKQRTSPLAVDVLRPSMFVNLDFDHPEFDGPKQKYGLDRSSIEPDALSAAYLGAGCSRDRESCCWPAHPEYPVRVMLELIMDEMWLYWEPDLLLRALHH